MTTKRKTETETRMAPVLLSDYHRGQIIEVTASMRAEGHYYRRDRQRRWKADRWQAIHATLDTSDRSRTEAVSPWFASMHEAERWLESRGLILGGAYWHAARPESAEAVR